MQGRGGASAFVLGRAITPGGSRRALAGRGVGWIAGCPAGPGRRPGQRLRE